MVSKKFQRHVENFSCEHCGTAVTGNGYTNHCPECFYSKHVDVNPGDRLAQCGGLMVPIAVEFQHSQWRVVQQCVKCAKVWRNQVRSQDNISQLIVLQQQFNT